MDIKEIVWEGVDWIHVAQERNQWRLLVNTVMNYRVLWKSGKFLSMWVTVSFSRRILFQDVSFVSSRTLVLLVKYSVYLSKFKTDTSSNWSCLLSHNACPLIIISHHSTYPKFPRSQMVTFSFACHEQNCWLLHTKPMWPQTLLYNVTSCRPEQYNISVLRGQYLATFHFFTVTCMT
jgi:hypothetical protein